MSSASAAVLFPDGEIRYGIYHGTSDLMYSSLYTTIDDAWSAWSDSRDPSKNSFPNVRELWEKGDAVEVFDVTIYSDHGGGWSWSGQATKTDIVDGFDPYDDSRSQTRVDGEPSWLVWRYLETTDEAYETSPQTIRKLK